MAMLKDGNKMPRISARLIGKQVGKNAHEVYLMLEKIGFIKKVTLLPYLDHIRGI